MKTDQIRAFSDEELLKKLEDSREEFLNLRFRLATRQLVNHREIPRVKKNIARMKTILRERELGAE